MAEPKLIIVVAAIGACSLLGCSTTRTESSSPTTAPTTLKGSTSSASSAPTTPIEASGSTKARGLADRNWGPNGLGELAWGTSVERAVDALVPDLGQPMERRDEFDPRSPCSGVLTGRHTYVRYPELALWFVDDALVGYRLEDGTLQSTWGFPQGAAIVDASRAAPSLVVERDPLERRLIWRIGPFDGSAPVAYGSVNNGVMERVVTVLSERGGPPCFD